MKDGKQKRWIIISIVIGVIAIAGVTVGVLAMNGALDSEGGDGVSCPAGQRKSCGVLSDGEVVCRCTGLPSVDKPIIYLYPEEETDVTVRLGNPNSLTYSYPAYIDGWDVTAYPNGDLVDRATGNRLYSLYWEGTKGACSLDRSVGFVVENTELVAFLEEKLEILGLNYREKEEFIVYWLPKLGVHKYNYIYFAAKEEIEEEMPLELSVKPDTIIRVRMIFEGLDDFEKIVEQQLAPAPERDGFTLVEWGGVDLTER